MSDTRDMIAGLRSYSYGFHDDAADAIEEQARELADAVETILAADAKIDEQASQIESLRADAMRYRWLLEKAGFGIRRNGVHELSFALYIQQPNHINELSACIDADLAIEKAKP